MPISFEQPGAYDRGISSRYGEAMALKDFMPYLQRAYSNGGGGSAGGGGGGPRFLGQGGGPGHDPGGGGGFGGRGGDSGFDPRQAREDQDRAQAEAAIRQNTADASPDEADITSLEDKRAEAAQRDGWSQEDYDSWAAGKPNANAGGPDPQGRDYNLENEDKPYGGNTTDPTADVHNPDGSIDGNSGNWRGQEAQPAPAPPQQEQPAEFTQSDALQLQRLQASRARVQAQLASGMVDPRTAERMIRQLQVPLSVLRQQEQAARTQAAQNVVQQQTEQHAHETAWMRMRAQDQAQFTREHTVDLGNGSSILTDYQGRTHVIRNENQAQRQEITPAHRLTISNHVTSDMSRERREASAAGFSGDRPAWMGSEQAAATERQRRINQAVREASGRPGSEPGQSPRQSSPPTQEDRQALERMLQGVSMPTLAPQNQPQPRAQGQRAGFSLPGFGGGANFE